MTDHPIPQSVPDNAVPIPGYDGDYLITPEGVVWSIKWGGPRIKTTRPGRNGPIVCLRRNNKRYRPRITTLMARTFGTTPDDAELVAEVLEDYPDNPDVKEWADSLSI